MNNKFNNAPAWSLGNRFGSKSQNKIGGVLVPGPGSYNLSTVRPQSGCKIGTSVRRSRNYITQPGPGNYDISWKNNGPKISIGSKLFPNGLSAPLLTPGPGNYNPIVMMSKSGAGVTMVGKYNSTFNKFSNQPGPGAYNLKANTKGGVLIGTAKRSDLGDKYENPGPGKYTVDQQSTSSVHHNYGFGKASRKSSLQANAPGPGQYNINSSIKNGENFGCTMGQKFKNEGNAHNLNPGPGSYNLNSKKHLSGIKIVKDKKKQGVDNYQKLPGPGAYNIASKSTLGTKIGKSCRDDFGGSPTPGPGTYQLAQQNKFGITISGNRGKAKIADVPGPGAYNLDQYNRGRPCSANMGKAIRTQGHKQDTPGPGQYYYRQDSRYKFAYTKQLRSTDLKKRGPGPGQYDIPPTVPSAPHYLIDPSVYKLSVSRS